MWRFVGLAGLLCCVASFAADQPQTESTEQPPPAVAQPVSSPTNDATPKTESARPDAERKADAAGGRTDDKDPPHRTSIGLKVGLLLLGLIVVAVLLYCAGRKPLEPYIFKLRASFFFWLGSGYLAFLLWLAWFYNDNVATTNLTLVGGLLPIAVPWFGALGAVTISMAGVFYWNQRHWNPEYNYWHIGRPLFGAVLGIVAYFMFVLIVSSAGSVPGFLDQPPKSYAAKDLIVYYVLAFLVGYREETFRELIQRVTDMILKPGNQQNGVAKIAYKVSGQIVPKVEFGDVTAGQPRSMDVQILNEGAGALVDPVLSLTDGNGGVSAAFAIEVDPLTGTKELAAGKEVTVKLKFLPPAVAQYVGQLAIKGSNMPAASVALAGAGI